MNFLNLFSSNEFVHALGWTILHSIWQIAIIALLLGITLLFMKRSSSSSRYYASIMALFLIIVLAIVTFANEYSSYSNEKPLAQDLQLSQIEQEYANAVISDQNKYWDVSLVESFKVYFDKNLPAIVIIWYLIVLVLLLKTIGGLAYSQRLKNYKTSLLPVYWEKKLAELSNKLGIQRSIQILESALVKVPVVIGYFKPVVLLPLGIVSGLSHEEVEAILAHELAHIKRNDYLVNIFQTVVEVLLFYHPAIYWISRNIRNERENACDDIAILANVNRKALARALTNLEVINQEKTLLALAFSGNKSSLFNRVRRILNPQKTKITMKEGFISICILLASLTIMSFSSNILTSSNANKRFAKSIKRPNKQAFNRPINDKRFDTELNVSAPINEFLPLYRDTIIQMNHNKGDISYSLNGKKYQLLFDNGKNVKAFYVNNKEIPKSKWGNYQTEIDHGFLVLKKHEIEMKKHEKDMRKHEADMEKHEREMRLHDEELKKHDEELAASEIELRKHKEKLALHEAEMKEHEQEMKEHEREMIEHEKKMKIHEHKMQIFDGLIDEMKKEGLIDKDVTSYKIIFNENELIINEKKQNSQVHKKYKQMFNEKSKGQYKLDLQLNVNPNFYGKNKDEILKKQLAKIDEYKQQLNKNLEKLEIKLKELKAKQEVIQAERKLSEDEKKKMLEKVMQYHEQIKKEHRMIELKMQQLIIEHKKLTEKKEE